MGIEGAYWLWIPIAFCLTVLPVLVVTDRGHWRQYKGVGMGRGRIAAGYLGIICMVSVICWWHSRDFTGKGATIGWTLLNTAVFGPLVLILFTLLGLPVLALLRKLRFASVIGVSLSAAAIAELLALMLTEALWIFLIYGVLVGVGFSVAARLPLMRNKSVRPHAADANTR